MDLITTIKGSLLENFFPAGWDLAAIDKLGALGPNRSPCASPGGTPPSSRSSAPPSRISTPTWATRSPSRSSRRGRAGQSIAFILPVGPMGMYRWAVYFLTEWGVACDHVHGFNMDEWSDAPGKTLPSDNPGGFQYAMEKAFYGPLGKLTVPAASVISP